MFEIIKNAPPIGKVRRNHTYPFADMEVMDVFFAPRDMGRNKGGGDSRQATISAFSRSYAKRHNPTAKFTVRLVDDATVACQRIA